MSTADALLRAVIDRPDDDLPRLAYADALDDAGDAARAEFVRVQVELARLPDHDPARPALEDREHDLLAANEADWLGDAGSAVEWHWSRGFVEEVAASPRWLLDRGDGVFAAHPVRRWRVHDGPDELDPFFQLDRAPWTGRIEVLDYTAYGPLGIGSGQFLAVANLGRLRELDIVTTEYDVDETPDFLQTLPPTDRLAALRITGAGGVRLDPAALAAALGGARLAELSLPNTGLTAEGLRHLLLAPCCRELTALDIADNALLPDAWEAFRDAPCRLRALDVSGTGLWNEGPGLLGHVALSELRELAADRTMLANRAVELVASPFWQQAEVLRTHAGNGDGILGPLWASAGPPGLRLLDFTWMGLDDGQVEGLAGAEWAGSLGWLGLVHYRLTDAAARTIGASGRFARLRTLILKPPDREDPEQGEPLMTGAGVIALAESPSLANLRLLAVNGTEVGLAGVDAALNGPHWRLSGLGLGGCDLPAAAARVLAGSPRLGRLEFLDLAGNPWLGGDALLPLAESPHLCPLLELDIRGVPVSDRVRAALRERLGRRLSD